MANTAKDVNCTDTVIKNTKNIADFRGEELARLLTIAGQQACAIEEIADQIKWRKDSAYNLESKKEEFSMAAVIIILLASLQVFALILKSETRMGLFFSIVIGLSAIYIIYKYFSNKRQKKIDANKEKAHLLTTEIENLKVDLDKALAKRSNIYFLIPPGYRYSLALNTMAGFIYNLRTSTWQGCVDKFEEQKHRWMMEKNSAEMYELQRQILLETEEIRCYAEKIYRFG